MSKRRAQGDIAIPSCCPYRCGKMFDPDINETNYQRHLFSCLFRDTEGTPRITSFIKQTLNQKEIFVTGSASSDVSVESTSYVTEGECSLYNKEVLVSTGINSRATVVSPTNTNLVEEKCEGITIDIQSGSFYSNYPFHRHDIVDPGLSPDYQIRISNDDTTDRLVAHSNLCNMVLLPDFVCNDG